MPIETLALSLIGIALMGIAPALPIRRLVAPRLTARLRLCKNVGPTRDPEFKASALTGLAQG